jgi:CRISPR system Cascade subunit CasE
MLFAHAESFADPAFSATLDLPHAPEPKCMRDDFPIGTRLGFRVRIRPVTRTGGRRADTTRADGPVPKKARERDAFLAHVDAMTAAETPAVPRAECYFNWLGSQLAGMGARLECGRIDAFRFTRLLTRDGVAAGRRRRYLNGPDAVATGTLKVIDTKDFAVGLARGVGRFRAFGFGMLLLSPPRD